MSPFNERLRAYRKAAGLKQEDLAVQLGVSAAAVSLWETDKAQPSIDRLPKLAAALGITVGALFD